MGERSGTITMTRRLLVVMLSIDPQFEIQSQIFKSRLARLNLHMEIHSKSRSTMIFDFPFRYFMMGENTITESSNNDWQVPAADLPSVWESLNLQFEDALTKSFDFNPMETAPVTTASTATACKTALKTTVTGQRQ